MSKWHVVNEDVGYLPVPCPCPARRFRLLYSTNRENHVVYAECEKCGWNSDMDDDDTPR